MAGGKQKKQEEKTVSFSYSYAQDFKLVESFRKKISKLNFVSKLAYFTSGSNVSIWTLLKDFSRKNLYKVYEAEQKTLDEFPELSIEFTALKSDAEPIPANFNQINMEI